MQEKFDARRLLLLKQGIAVRGINRKGLFVGIPESIHKYALRIDGDFLIDGEAIGERYYPFDLLNRNGEDLRHLPYGARLENLAIITECLDSDAIQIVTTCMTPEEKRTLLVGLKRSNAEGVVFKHREAPYTAGRPNTGGNQLKCKFYATASFIVVAINKQRSVLLTLMQDGEQVPAGNVTVPANQTIPTVGQIVEVRYLYAFKESGSVYQPVYLGRREDVDAEACTATQLKYKASLEEDDADQ